MLVWLRLYPLSLLPGPLCSCLGFTLDCQEGEKGALDSVVLGTPRTALKVNPLSFWEPIL